MVDNHSLKPSEKKSIYFKVYALRKGKTYLRFTSWYAIDKFKTRRKTQYLKKNPLIDQ